MPQIVSLNAYQRLAKEFAAYSNPDYPFLALGEEAGEVLGKLAKFTRKNDVTAGMAVGLARHGKEPERNKLRTDLITELGDVLWQLQACCTELGVSLEDVANYNLTKLEGRASRGTIVGAGDDR